LGSQSHPVHHPEWHLAGPQPLDFGVWDYDAHLGDLVRVEALDTLAARQRDEIPVRRTTDVLWGNDDDRAATDQCDLDGTIASHLSDLLAADHLGGLQRSARVSTSIVHEPARARHWDPHGPVPGT